MLQCKDYGKRFSRGFGIWGGVYRAARPNRVPSEISHGTEAGEPYRAGERIFLAFTAAAYRTPEDPMPGLGTAWEPVPGTTPYTKDSEMMNAETSAWGRAILAVGAADTRKGIASREEVQARRGDS
jgi:hypothetical protein